MLPRPVMFGCAGTRLTALEYQLFREARPFGFILFKRNCENAAQIRYLIGELRAASGRPDAVIAIDQEGGRVSRLPARAEARYPAARQFGLMYEADPAWGLDAIRLYGRILAHELLALGIGINCAPVLDLFNPKGTPALGDRAYSADPDAVAALGRALCESFLAAGLLPVIKHIPGHGRLKADPHLLLPKIDASLDELTARDFRPFIALADMPLAMNSHAVLTAIDPASPASLSLAVNRDLVRDRIGFQGLMLSDDLTMKALRGPMGDVARRALAAGNDIILHCSGDASEMEAIVRATEPMGDDLWQRWCSAQTRLGLRNTVYDPGTDIAQLDVLLGGLAALGAVG